MLRFILAFWLAITPAFADGVAVPGIPSIGQTGAAVSYPPVSGGSCASPPSLDGSAATADWSSGDTFTVTLTINANDVVFVFVAVNGFSSASTFVTVSDAAGLTWTQRATSASSGSEPIIEFWAKSSATHASDTITISGMTAAGSSYASAGAFAVSGANFTSPFDPNGSLPVTTTGTNPSVSTTNGCTFVVGAFRISTPTIPAGSGFTAITNHNYMMTEYQQFTNSPQSGLSVTYGGTGSNGAIGDALTE